MNIAGEDTSVVVARIAEIDLILPRTRTANVSSPPLW
jgi:hypothetical protein